MPVRKLSSLLVATVILGRVVFAPPAFGAAASAPIDQAEAQSFVSSFYRDLEEGDVDKVMAHFDQTVEHYSSGPKRQAVIAKVFETYFAYYPSRSFSIAAVKLKPSPKADRVTVNFDLRSFLRDPERDVNKSSHALVEWDLVKRDGVVKIIRYSGTPATKPAPSPSK